jgi:hypothetical protein
MGKRWVRIDKDGQPVARREQQRLAVDKAKRYTRVEVEQMVAKALTAAGVDPTKVVAKSVGKITPGKRPVKKSAAAVEADRTRQRQLNADLERQVMQKRRDQLLSAGDWLGRMTARPSGSGRAAVDFERGDHTTGGEGAVTRLALDQP